MNISCSIFLVKIVVRRSVESGWYEWWKSRGFFSASVYGGERQQDRKMEKRRFSMVLPPPNVTGVLHLGHALTATIQVGPFFELVKSVLLNSYSRHLC